MMKRTLYLITSLAVASIAAVALVRNSTVPPAASLAAPSWTEPVIPDTPAGRQLRSFLVAFNGGHEDELKQFIKTQFTPLGPGGSDLAARTNSQLRLYKTSRGLNLYEVAESSDESITVVAQFRLTQEWRRMTFMIEDAPSHRISGIKIVPVDAPVIATTKPQTNKQFRHEIDDYIQSLVAVDQFSGVVLVAKDGAPLFEKAYAMANRELGWPNQPSTRFSFASVGKMFTAVAVAQLVHAGKLAYDEPLTRLLPEFPADTARQITIDHLLTHRSGIIDFFANSERFKQVMDSSNPQRDYLSVFIDEPLRFTPGERFEYSNSNYILLGAIIERLSGLTYEEYLLKHVFGPAGMSETGLSTAEVGEHLMATAYTQMGENEQLGVGARHPFTVFSSPTGSAAGGGYTTARDLLKFERALRTHKLLPASATEQLLVDRVEYERPGYRYGYGFILRQAGQERVAGHSGGFPGVDAQFDMYLDSGYSIIVLSNYELVAEPITMHIQQLLRRT